MRGFSDRVIALVLACMLLAAGMTAARSGPYEDALAHFTEDSFDQTIEGVSGIVASGNALAVAVIGALQEGRLLFDTQSKRVFIRDKSDRLLDAVDRAAFRRRCACRHFAGAHQQSPAPHHRGGARELDVAGSRPDKTPGGRPGGLQVQGRRCARCPRPGDRCGNRRPGAAGVDSGPCRGGAVSRQFTRCREDRRSDGDPAARRSGRARIACRTAGKRHACREESCGRRHCLDREQSCALGWSAERMVRTIARLGSSARRHRPRHHLRRDGRDQHGARRNGHARRLHHFRGPGGDPRA